MADAKGADLSHWQDDGAFSAVLGWADFVHIKACTGGSVDPEFSGRWGDLKRSVDAGDVVMRGAYNFLVGGDGAKDADSLIALMGSVGKSVRGAADFEDPRSTYSDLVAFGTRYKAVMGHKALLYGGAMLKALSLAQRTALKGLFDLWLADWSAPYATIEPWPAYTFLQYEGIGLDLDEFAGSRNKLAQYLGTAETPKPPPKKKPEEGFLMGLSQGEQENIRKNEAAVRRFMNGVCEGFNLDPEVDDQQREAGKKLAELLTAIAAK